MVSYERSRLLDRVTLRWKEAVIAEDFSRLFLGRPDPPTGLQVASVTHNSVTLQWTAGFDGGLEQKFRVR